MSRSHLIPLLLLGCLVTVAPAQNDGGIRWAESLADALSEAARSKKVVALVFDIDGDRASDEMRRVHHGDPAIRRLAAQTINVFCSNGTHGPSVKQKPGDSCTRCGSGPCLGHRNNDFNARKKFFDVEGQTKVVAQHVFVSPDGTVLCSASRYVTVGELEWLWVWAIRRVNSQFEWAETGRFRAPEQFRKADVDRTQSLRTPPPTRKQVTEALKAAKKEGVGGGRGWGRGRGRGGFGQPTAGDRRLDVIVRSDTSAARSYVKWFLEDSSRNRSRTIARIGRLSSEAWVKVVTPWLSDDSDRVRGASVRALRHLRSDKALSSLRNAYRREKDDALKGRILRAMAVVAPTSGPVISEVKKATKHKSEVVRAYAMVAAGVLEDRAAVTECLGAGLQDTTELGRATAAYIIAIRQDKELLPALLAAVRVESVAETGDWMRKAQTAVQDSDAQAFDGYFDTAINEATRR